jgi:cytochrome P450
VVESATGCRHNAERVVGHSPTMSPSPSLPRQLIDTLFNGQLHDTLAPALREQLKIRPPRPSRGLTSNLVSIFLTRPYAAQLLLQHVVPLFRRIIDFGSVAFYDKHREVRDILDRDDDFPSGPTIGPGLVSGDFILGMDRCPLHRSDLAMLWEALYRIEPELGKPLPKNGPGPKSEWVEKQLRQNGWFDRLEAVVVNPIDDKVKRSIKRALNRKGSQYGKIDLVQEVFRPACVEIVVQHYLGIGPVDKKWAESLWDILQIIGIGIALPYDLLLTNTTDPVIREVSWAAKALEIAVKEAVGNTSAEYRKAVIEPNEADDKRIEDARAAFHNRVDNAIDDGGAGKHAPVATITIAAAVHAVITAGAAGQDGTIAVAEDAAAVVAVATAVQDGSIDAVARAKETYDREVAEIQAHQDGRLRDFLDNADLIGRMYASLVRKGIQEPEIPDVILRNVAGIAIAGCPPVAKAAAQVVDVLLCRPLAFQGASDAARKAVDPTLTDEDRKTYRALFWDFIFEALRFFPPFPLLTRACVRDTSTATSEGDRRKVRAGQTVVVGMLPAMFDEEAVPFPDQFRTDRAPGDSLVFGRGLHACLGFQLAREVLVAMLLPLFAHGFERIPGQQGKLRFDLLAVKNLKVKVNPAAAEP